MKIGKIGRLALLFAVFSAFFSLVIKGCEYFPESTFQLANDSRLPKWVSIPPGLTRADVSVTMNYYSMPIVDDAQFILKDRKGKVLAKVSGKTKDLRPKRQPFDYPAYVAITVNGETDIIEHKRMEPIFYVTDDPAVWKELPDE
jgi:hypothetical protein